MAKATNGDRPSSPPKRTIVLIDGYGLAFRAFHAIPMSLSTAAGELTNATFGFTSMLLDVLRAHAPDCVLMTFDVGKSFRADTFEAYKAHRAPMPEEMRGQMKRIRDVIDRLNIPIYESDGFEADDVIGTLAQQAVDQGLHALIVTGDSDLLQLVDDHVTAVLPGAQRFGEYRVFDRQAVLDRYGFGPERLAEYKALVGDKSDNIPGVPGIGEKTAKTLIDQFGSLEELFENLESIAPPRARNALTENVDLAYQCRELATIVRNVPVELDVDRCVVGDYDRDGAVNLFRELEFRSLAARLPDSHRESTIVASEPSGQLAEPVAILDRDSLAGLANDIATAAEISLDVETDSTSPILSNLVGIAVATSPTRAFYVPTAHATEPVLSMDVIREALAQALTSHPNVVTHHGKFDLAVLERHGFNGITINFDTMLAAYLMGETGIGLKDLAFRHLGWEMTPITDLIGTGRSQITMDHVPIENVTRYAGADVESTMRLRPPLQDTLSARGQMDLLTSIELPLVPVLIEMESIGIAVDVDVLIRINVEITAQIDALERRIYEMVGHEFNLGSTRQLATLLFDELGLPSGRRTKTGYSVGQEVLDTLRGEHPVVDMILEQRTLKKLKSTYVDALPQQINPRTGRVHTTYNQTIASTGRLSSTDPNLQNIPIRTPVGRQVRRAFVADNRPEYRRFDEPSILFSADYSQMELRIMAHYSQDEALVSAFQQGLDIHAATAAEINGIDIADVTSDQRSMAKSVNFGIMYGMQAYGLSRDTGMSRSDSVAFIERYMSRFQGVRAYLDSTIRQAVKDGYVSSLFGRRRYVPDINAQGPRRQAAERAAINMPLQGTASDIMKIAMIRVADGLRRSKLRGEMLLQVHDELLFETPVSELDALRALVVETMEGAAELSVPLRVETSIGPNWEEMRDFTGEASESA
ncbi:MAG TPA: DNA polymerase I [Thermomicrobiales bacterium]|nr:DNA polymerase I [Thermomicrobiales bacterium]